MEEAAQLLVPPLQSWQPVYLLPVVQVRRIEVGRVRRTDPLPESLPR